MDYREMAIKTVKIACQDLMDRADEIIPKGESITDIDVIMHIPSLTDDSECIPTISVQVDGYVSRIAFEKICEMLNQRWKK